MLGRPAEKSGTIVGLTGAFRDARHDSQRFHTRRTNCMRLSLGHVVRREKGRERAGDRWGGGLVDWGSGYWRVGGMDQLPAVGRPIHQTTKPPNHQSTIPPPDRQSIPILSLTTPSVS